VFSTLFAGSAILYTGKANREQQQLTEQGQITERFNKAIEQLGSGSVTLRRKPDRREPHQHEDAPATTSAGHALDVLAAQKRCSSRRDRRVR
jgi:hypothetical protein